MIQRAERSNSCALTDPDLTPSTIARGCQIIDRSLMVRFRGQREPVDWEVEFTPPAGG